jgi:hypothetical protein
MANAWVVVIWFNRPGHAQWSPELVVGKSLEAAKNTISERLEQGKELAWHDGRSFSACEPIEPTKHYYTIHEVDVIY